MTYKEKKLKQGRKNLNLSKKPVHLVFADDGSVLEAKESKTLRKAKHFFEDLQKGQKDSSVAEISEVSELDLLKVKDMSEPSSDISETDVNISEKDFSTVVASTSQDLDEVTMEVTDTVPASDRLAQDATNSDGDVDITDTVPVSDRLVQDVTDLGADEETSQFSEEVSEDTIAQTSGNTGMKFER